MFNYIADGQISLFDYIEPEHKFAPVIDELSTDLSNLFANNDYSEEYEVWDHVPYLGYRYMFNTSVNSKNILNYKQVRRNKNINIIKITAHKILRPKTI